ncbi:MAG: DUF3267 domain-containing protein [Pirellulales bacterium]
MLGVDQSPRCRLVQHCGKQLADARHGSFVPGLGRGPRTAPCRGASRLGNFACDRHRAWPSRLLFYAHYCGPLSRDRFLAVLVMPLLVITGLPLLLAALGWLPAWSTPVLASFSIWNALFACGDMVGLLLILAQIPRRAIVQNQGWRTYWKPQ